MGQSSLVIALKACEYRPVALELPDAVNRAEALSTVVTVATTRKYE